MASDGGQQNSGEQSGVNCAPGHPKIRPTLQDRLLQAMLLLVVLLVTTCAAVTYLTTSASLQGTRTITGLPLTAELVMFGLGLALVAAVWCRWVVRHLLAPLRRLSAEVRLAASDDISYRLPVGGSREVAGLATAFNTLLDRMQQCMKETGSYRIALSMLNETLEDQIWNRTLALQTSVEKYRTLVEHSPGSMLILQDGKVRFVNACFERTFGISTEAALSAEFELASLFSNRAASVITEINDWESGEIPAPVTVVTRAAGDGDREVAIWFSRMAYMGKPALAILLVDVVAVRAPVATRMD